MKNFVVLPKESRELKELNEKNKRKMQLSKNKDILIKTYDISYKLPKVNTGL